MPAKKIRVGVMFGGKSAEHEVSLQSAKNVVNSLDRDKYDVVLIGVDKSGQFFLHQSAEFLLNENNPKLIALNRTSDDIALIPGTEKKELISLQTSEPLGQVDVIFPVLHGPFGEDGTVQGLLKLANTPFVGASVLGSAVGMDKDVMKRLLHEAQIPIPRFLVAHHHRQNELSYEKVVKEIGSPLFIKPANLGSSVGITKVDNKNKFAPAMQSAFQYDQKILLEEAIQGREIEIAVLGNQDPIASVAGEIIPQHDFYSYEAKYIDENGARLQAPVELPQDILKKLQEMAIHAFQTLCCEGMARVDFFLTPENRILLNEINTIPGFTKISMYPKLWELSGISNQGLVDRLIQLALDRFEREMKLKVTY